MSVFRPLCTFLTSFSVAATTITRLRSCWTEAGPCSGSRWPPVGSVSSSTCGPSSLPWSAPSALKPRTATSVAGILWKTFSRRCDAEPRNLHRRPFTVKHNPVLLPSALKMEHYLLPFALYLGVFALFYNVKTLTVICYFYYHLFLEFCISCRFVLT